MGLGRRYAAPMSSTLGNVHHMIRSFLKFAIYFLLGIGVVALGDYLYRLMLIPISHNYVSIPLYLWAVAYAPIIILLVIIGINSKSALELMRHVIAVTFGRQCYGYYAAKNCYPGHLKSFAIEDIGYYFTVISLGYFFVFVMLALLSYSSVKHRRARPNNSV